MGTNELIGTNPVLLSSQLEIGINPPLWDDKTMERIVAHLERLLIE
ncbi:hypothetical protein [Sediminihaliea albiluteola]|nr:hypothetical protein [Sediminihaliea albiluteola]